MPKVLITPTCKYCGSTAVLKDAYAEWDAEAQEWVLQDVYDYAVCNGPECNGNETKIILVETAVPNGQA